MYVFRGIRNSRTMLRYAVRHGMREYTHRKRRRKLPYMGWYQPREWNPPVWVIFLLTAIVGLLLYIIGEIF